MVTQETIDNKVDKMYEAISQNKPYATFLGSLNKSIKKLEKARLELEVIAQHYNEDSNSLTKSQKLRLSKLEKNLAYWRFGISAAMLGIGAATGYLSYAHFKEIMENGYNFDIAFGASLMGITSILGGLASLGFVYLGNIIYKDAKSIK